MCGIFAFLAESKINNGIWKNINLKRYANKIKHRGPDNTISEQINDNLYFHFHRLMINGLNDESNQPFYMNGIWLICNGEIYNYKTLIDTNGFEYKTNSDCEVIIHMYLKYGIEYTCKHLDGVFAFVLYDENKDILIAARDHLGIRPLYVGIVNEDNYNTLAFASEAKALTFMYKVRQFPPRHYWTSEDNSYYNYYNLNEKFDYKQNDISNDTEETICCRIRYLLTEAVRKRFITTDVEVGCLLSGGLDSSLISSICSRMFDIPKRLKTFSIGLKGSPDLENAQAVADMIGTTHYSYEVSEKDFLDAIEETIYALGSYDITTVRASVGHMLVSKYVRRDTNVKVLFSGEVADEMGSYLYMLNAPSNDEYHTECTRLLSDIHFFDGLRSDRSISYAGLEARVPFSDKEFMEYYMSVSPKLKMFNNKDRIEKYLIRKAFSKHMYLPDSVLWRRKNGFSDSVSSKTRSWSIIIQEYVDKLISDKEFETESVKYTHNPPLTKEAYYYRKVFHEKYDEGGYSYNNLTPYMWLPKWCGDIKDPSARVLNIYKAD